MVTTRIDYYFVQYSSGGNSKKIELRNANGTFAYLNFMPEGITMPADSIVDGKKHLSYRMSDFANCLDLLRNEDPCYLRWDGTSAGSVNSIGTSTEVVGEGEQSS